MVLRPGRSLDAEYSFNPMDINDFEKQIEILNPDIVINTIAMTNVDQCELDHTLCFNTNIVPVKNFYFLNKKKSYKFIHISTDQVYSGNGPHYENSEKPINSYGWSKMCADYIALNASALVLRTNFLGYIEGRANFVSFLLDHFKKKQSFFLFKNIVFNPLYVGDLCQIIAELIYNDRYSMIVNLGASSYASKAAVALKIAQILNLDASYAQEIDYNPKENKAVRPFDMRMNVDKINGLLHSKLPDIDQTIERLCQSIKV